VEQFKAAFEIAGITEDELHIREARLLRASGTLVLRVYKTKGTDPDDLALWETEIRKLLLPHKTEFLYEDADAIQPETQTVTLRVPKPKPPSDDLPPSGILMGGKIEGRKTRPIAELQDGLAAVAIAGQLVSCELKESWAKAKTRGAEKYRVRFNLTDFTDSVYCSAVFDEEGKAQRFLRRLELAHAQGKDLKVAGVPKTDKFGLIFYVDQVNLKEREQRQDTSLEKRVELHLHTKMSAKDGLTDVAALMATVKRFGHPAVAITDHGVAQAFPDAFVAARKNGVKVLFGVEGYLLPDSTEIETNQPIIAFDLETTGFDPVKCEIIEIGAVKIVDGKITDRFQTFVDGGAVIPYQITKLTGITRAMLEGAPGPREALTAFQTFCGGACLAAHNAKFDLGFLSAHSGRFGIEFNQPCADTLMLARYLLRDILPNRKLATVCEHFGIDMGSHHRADDDAASCAQVLLRLVDMLAERGVSKIPVISGQWSVVSGQKEKQQTCHILLLAETQAGLKNLYKLISYSHLGHFVRGRPVIPRSMLHVFREGLLVGSACEAGELFTAVLEGAPEEELKDIASFYDFLEIMPIANNAFLLREGKVADEAGLRDLNRQIAALGETLGIPVAATGDVHFLEPHDAEYRKIIQFKQGYADAGLQAPLYLKTTEEMLEEFAYLGEDKAREAVITVPNAIAQRCGKLKPFPDDPHAPKLPDAEQELQAMARSRAHELYGNPLPDIVEARLDKELKSILGNGFASLYLMAQRLVQKSLSDGYLVGSRGSVGSSFVATMAGITEVNPLAPHYICPACRYSDFEVDKSRYAIGADMPDKLCPRCGAALRKEGFEIPFEVFLGFDGDKIPDIDLNFSGEYQAKAHAFVEEMVGKGHAYRGGTVMGVAPKTGRGYVLHYQEQTGRVYRDAEVERLARGCKDVKLTTGQHPGGIVVLPRGEEIYDFTPVQRPADKTERDTVTTHFDYHALEDCLVKLDILGKDDPTMFRLLEVQTGVSPMDIPLDEKETLALFSGSEPLGADLSKIDCRLGTLGVPEYGTGFVRQVLETTRPDTVEELVRIAGLTHGENVWLNNAEPLIANGIAKLSEAICTRDDIMNYLIARGLSASLSFKIMERVRKGKGLSPEMEQAMSETEGIPPWYIDSCKKIKYMFPRGHAVAYAVTAFRIAWFKLYFPQAYYAAHFTVRGKVFDISKATGGAEAVLANIQQIDRAMQSKETSERKKDKDLITMLESVYEMNQRGIAMLPVDIFASHATNFIVEDGGLRPPFSSVTGVGQAAAEAMAEKRNDHSAFISVQDFAEKTGVSSAVIDALDACGCFAGLPKQNQISLFDF